MKCFLGLLIGRDFSSGAAHRWNVQVSALLQESPDTYQLTEDLLIDRTAVHG